MKLLLDTVAFLKATLGPTELPIRARELLLNPENERYLSTVSCWEIAIKYSRRSLPLPESPERFIPKHREILAVESLLLDEESAVHLVRLPPLHRDPFDRMLVCQAIVHGMVILTPDDWIGQYPVRTAW